MLQCVGILNDTIKELKEFLEEQASTSGEEGLDAIELDDDFAFDSSLSDEERSVFESGVKLLEMVVSVLKRGVLTLKNLTIEDSAKDVIAWTARLDRGYKTVQAAVVDMGAALYPPVDVDELQSALDLVSKSGRAVLESLLAQQDLGDKEIHALESGCRAAEFVGYSLWLIPAGGPHEALQQLIVEYAARLMTPPFLPHITLLGGVTGLSEQEAIDKTRSVATMLHAMDLEVSVVASKELLYFQCVFGLIKKDDELASAHEAAKEVRQ
ncbi:hypothetical protein P43SY_009132 [Pythium insidiosum]|uniref:Uncharacterized protein n=1 Tax=Pythium insidiosum TaxID=114742 RepID=A0AAD5LFU2_PYTIN|nr:hypothetical protein P43SY_009132 [Pythium insidiosum]